MLGEASSTEIHGLVNKMFTAIGLRRTALSRKAVHTIYYMHFLVLAIARTSVSFRSLLLFVPSSLALFVFCLLALNVVQCISRV